MDRLTAINAIIKLVLLALATVGAAAAGWTFFMTPKSAVTGPAANPTPAQQTAGAIGNVAGGVGDTAQAGGSLAQTISSNPTLLLVGGLVIFLLIGGRR